MKAITYNAWISDNYPDRDSANNQCNAAVRRMVDKFPELSVQVGRAEGKYHCWCIDEEGAVVDPTAAQFREATGLKYVVIADRFLDRDEIELSTGAIFLTH